MFIDTHCHFDFPPFVGDESNSLAKAAAVGVNGLIVPAVSHARFNLILDLAQKYNTVYAALGLHPIYHHQITDLDVLESLLAKGQFMQRKIVAIGEIGLDRYVESPLFAEQESFFTAQLALAKRYDLPVILHSRRAHDAVYLHLKKAQLPRCGVVHGFSGSLEQAKQFIRLGYHIGVGGVITYCRANKTREAIAKLPLSSLVLETDAPDMPVFGYQGQANRPERLIDIFNSLCEIRAEALDVIQQTLIENTQQLFSLPIQ